MPSNAQTLLLKERPFRQEGFGGRALLPECPAGGENAARFHPLANLTPILAEESAAGRQNIAMRSAPAGGENAARFHPFANLTPILAEESAAGRQNTAMRRLCFPCGRAMPPHGGILPAVTMPDRGEMNK
jgi:hypothetical protein